jgi:hypothetical protein
MEEPEVIRVSGDAICPLCAKKYRDHPWSSKFLYEGLEFLKEGCDGRLLKL